MVSPVRFKIGDERRTTVSVAGLAGIAVRGITSTRLAMGPRCEDPDRRGRQAEETGKRPAIPASRGWSGPSGVDGVVIIW